MYLATNIHPGGTMAKLSLVAACGDGFKLTAVRGNDRALVGGVRAR